jgi:hypothetical protein
MMYIRRIRTVLSCYILCAASPSFAAYRCSGILTDSEVAGFNTFFSPPFSPSLKMVNGEQFKMLSGAEFTTLSNSSNAPLARQMLTREQAKNLKSWLNNHTVSTIPAWFSTGLGVLNTSVGLIADLALQWNSAVSSDAHIAVANLAGTVAPKGIVEVIPSAITIDNQRKYVWFYAYLAEINGQKYVTVLHACQADVALR